MITLPKKEISKLTETEEQKLKKTNESKLLSAAEKIVEGVEGLMKEAKENADKVAESITQLGSKIDELKNKEQEKVDFSEVTSAIDKLSEANKANGKIKIDFSKVIESINELRESINKDDYHEELIRLFSEELKSNRMEIKNMVDAMQPKDYDERFRAIEDKLERSGEWRFDFIRNLGLVQSINVKEIKK